MGARQLELLFEKESGELTLYVLGSRKLTAQPISAVPFRCRSWIEVRLRFAGRAEPERFNFSFDGAAD